MFDTLRRENTNFVNVLLSENVELRSADRVPNAPAQRDERVVDASFEDQGPGDLQSLEFDGGQHLYIGKRLLSVKQSG